MDFFESQAEARRKTVALLAMFILATIGMVLASNLILVLLDYWAASKDATRPLYHHTRTEGPKISIAVAGTIILASLIRLFTLRRGGAAIAEMLDGELLTDPGGDPDKRKLLNLVSEMAIASGTPEPPVYLLNDSAINAFAAGFRPEDAVIGVTIGAIKQLNRDELQGVIGHEFSHILNGDMRINIRLICVNFGLNVIGWIGVGLLAVFGSTLVAAFKHWVTVLMFIALLMVINHYIPDLLTAIIIAPGLLVAGGLGKFFGKMLNAAVSRQREYLADASSVQFTRNPAGIAGALKRIGGYERGSMVMHPKKDIVSHAFFCQAISNAFAGLFATHPPLTTRIREIEPEWNGDYQNSKSAEPTVANEQPDLTSDAVPTSALKRSAPAFSGTGLLLFVASAVGIGLLSTTALVGWEVLSSTNWYTGVEPPVAPRRPPPVVVSATKPHTPTRITAPKTPVIRHAGDKFRDPMANGNKGPWLIVIPTGQFRMGDQHNSGEAREQPVHKVHIRTAFAMGQHEVTYLEYYKYSREAGVEEPDHAGTAIIAGRPVINVSWHDAQGYLAWLSNQTGQVYRLPTESEWAYAARAGSNSLYFWGNSPSARHANGKQKDGWPDDEWGATSAVGSFRPNAFGLYDMAGNVWEWVQDCWHDSYNGAPDDGSAWTTPRPGSSDTCTKRMMRGGSWDSAPKNMRAAKRVGMDDTGKHTTAGFRVVRVLPQISRRARLSTLDARFSSHIKNDRLSKGSSGSALATLREIEALNPGKDKLDLYRQRIATRYAELATAALARGDIKKATTYVTTGQRISNIPTLVRLSGDIKREESRRKRAGQE